MTTTQIDIRRWNAEEFERLVLDAQPKVAVFDCDGTIWSGDSGSAFLVWSLEQGLVSRSTSDWIDTRYRAYLAGKVSELEICGEIVQIYAGLREQELRRSAAEFVEQFVKPRIFPEINSLIATLGRAGVELWAVSSTNRWVVVEGVRPLGIPEQRVLAVEARVVDGLITSQILSVPTDKGKAEALRQVGLPSPDVVFGNSIHDLAMLEIARCAFPVNPTPALLQAAARRGWGYFRPEAAQGTEAAVGGE